MKLYNSVGPNPQVVRIFLHEKGVNLPTQDIDLPGGENRREPYVTNVNTRGQSPALELDDGSHVCEITAICEYIEDKYPEPALIGSTPEEKATTRMWTRRIDLAIAEPLLNGFRYGDAYDFFKDRMRLIPEAADGLKALTRDNLGWLDGEIAGKTFVVGDRFTLADVLLFCMIDFAEKRGQPMGDDFPNIRAWYDRVRTRPSTAA